MKNRNNSDGTLVRKPEKIDSISLTNEGGPPRLQCGNYFFYYLQNKKSVLGESRQILNFVMTDTDEKYFHLVFRYLGLEKGRNTTLISRLVIHSCRIQNNARLNR